MPNNIKMTRSPLYLESMQSQSILRRLALVPRLPSCVRAIYTSLIICSTILRLLLLCAATQIMISSLMRKLSKRPARSSTIILEKATPRPISLPLQILFLASSINVLLWLFEEAYKASQEATSNWTWTNLLQASWTPRPEFHYHYRLSPPPCSKECVPAPPLNFKILKDELHRQVLWCAATQNTTSCPWTPAPAPALVPVIAQAASAPAPAPALTLAPIPDLDQRAPAHVPNVNVYGSLLLSASQASRKARVRRRSPMRVRRRRAWAHTVRNVTSRKLLSSPTVSPRLCCSSSISNNYVLTQNPERDMMPS